MLYEVIMSVMMNICLLIVLATGLTKLTFVQALLLNRDEAGSEGGGRIYKKTADRLILGAIFGGFCIISDYIGIQVEGAIPNARVIGVLSAGFLGGPISGMTTTFIAAVHRYMIFPERISTVACVIAAVLHGVIGSVIGYVKKDNKDYSNTYLLMVTFVAEAIHMGLILIMTRPYAEALQIVKIVIVPMVIINSVGMVVFFHVFKSVFTWEDMKVAGTVSLALRITERCTPYLTNAEKNSQSMQQIINIIMDEYRCVGVAVIKEHEFLGRSSIFYDIILNKSSYPRLLSATENYQTTRISKLPVPEDAFFPLYEKNVIFSAPIVKAKDDVLSLVMVIRKNSYSNRADIEFVTGLANNFATQLKLAQMEIQKEELRNAEIQTLQAQINPHFLFNALNTISCFCREKPEKARELLMALSSYFRNMLENIDYMILLETELEHVRAYVMLEEARFEDHLRVSLEIDESACMVRVPNLILQPIVENAIRHGATKREKGVVDIKIEKKETSILIDVSDNGPGMAQEIIDSFYNGQKIKRREKHGIGLYNVRQRLHSIYGKNAGLQILSDESGTMVRMIIPNQKESTNEDSSCRR